MDQSEFEALRARGKSIPKVAQAAPVASETPAAQPPAAEQPAIDFEALSGAAEAAGLDLGGLVPEGVMPVHPELGEEPTAADYDAAGRREDGTPYGQAPAEEPALGDPSGLDALAGGGLKSVFETKDFLFGDTPPEERSDFRASVEDTVALRGEQSAIDGVAAGIGQFAGAMFGLGKFIKLGQYVPWFGSGLGFLEATKKGKAVLEATKAATAGSVAFDPWEARLSNMLAGTPIAGPAFEYLAADPDDSAMEGRFKAALESIALDATLIGVFIGATRTWKYMRKGDAIGARREVRKFEAAQQEALANENVLPDAGGTPPASAPNGPSVVGDELPIAPDLDTPEVGQAAPAGVDPNVPQPEVADAGSPAAGPAPGAASPEAGVGASGPSVTPSSGAAIESATGQPPVNTRLGRLRVTDENTEEVLKGMEADAKALADNEGSHAKAIEAGHTFGKGEGIPYEKLNNEVDIQNFMDRVVEVKQEAIDRAKGGAVLSDERVNNIVGKMADLYNEDPALVMGALQKAGVNAREAVVYMETGFQVTNRIFQDAHALAQRITLGDYTGYGNREGAVAELRKLLGAGASAYSASRSIMANAGRAVRRMRWEFSVDPLQVQALQTMDGDELTKLMVATGGNPKAIAKVAKPGWFQQGMTGMGWLLVNNLVSGPITQVINLMGNGYMLGVRPLERMIGSAVPGMLGSVRHAGAFKEATKQYAYMGAAMQDSWRFALKAFMRNDSILSPHNTEQFQPGQAMAAAASQAYQWKPWDSVGNVLENAVNVATKNMFTRGAVAAIGLPTRILGTVDEAVKQTVYRSKVMANAHLEAVERAAQLPKGTTEDAKKAFIKKYVRDRVDNSVDAQGRGLDAQALQEAQMATFQQDLLPSTFGRSMQTMVSRHPAMRFIFPFVKTPTNVLRYGWKMTPGLNLLQTEYQQMLRGKHGAEAQAQAVGQMSLGLLYTGSVAFILSEGVVTGGGPTEWSTNAALQDTGYKPYSIVFTDSDGNTKYVPYNRFDPVAMPIGIMADIMDAIEVYGEDNASVQEVIGALGYALAKQMANKTYLMGAQEFMDVMQDPDPNKVQKWIGRQASNLVPYSAMLRQVNPDPYMREVRTMADKLMAGLPGYSEKVPPKYDWLGNPRVVRKGLWSTKEDRLVDNELVRLGLENGGNILTVAQPNQHGVDLRDITMSDGENAYAAYQRLSGKPFPNAPSLRQTVAKLMQSKAYRDAPDGEVGTKGTRLWLLHKPVSQYRETAMKLLKRDPVIRDAFGEDLKKVIDHYSELRGQAKRRKEVNLAPLDKVGEAFNVELGVGAE